LQDYDPYIEYQDDEYEYEEYHEPPTTPPTFDPAAILDSSAEYHRRYFPQPLNSNGDRYLIHKQPKHNNNKSNFSVVEGPINQLPTQDMLDYHVPCPQRRSVQLRLYPFR